MNYVQNKLALALKSGKSNNVGVIVPRIDSNFFSAVIRGIEEELNPHGYHVIICQTNGDEKKEHSTILNRIYLGRFPIMLQSELCILNTLNKDVRFNMGECRNDYGG
jgi:hypothetical protein